MGLDLFLEGKIDFKKEGENYSDYVKRNNIVHVHFSYGWFDEIRTLIAEKIGVNLDEMDGFGGNKTWETIVNPMKFLLNHSDCNGELTVEECKQMLEPLQTIITDNKYTDDEKEGLDDLYYIFSESVKQNRKIEFC